MKSPNLFGGLFLIFLGAIFLLNNFGLIGWDIWLTFISFWPLFLIALGLRIMFRNNVFVQIVALLIILVVPIGYYLGYGTYNIFASWGAGQFQVHDWSMENDASLSKAKLNLEFGAGKLTVNATGKLVDVQAGTSTGRPDIKVNRNNDLADISIKQDLKRFPISMIPRQGSWNEDWVLRLSKDVIWDLDFQTGATKAEFNLKDIKFSKLDVDTGAGDVRLILGDMGTNAQVDLDSGAGNVTFVIPENVGVKAKINTGIGQKNLPGRTWQQQNDTYTSANYSQASTKIEIDLDHGVGNVNIVTE